MNRKNSRFVVENTGTDKMLTGAMIITDTQTDVQYLYVSSGYGGGVTVLVDRDGKPILASKQEKNLN